MNVLGITLPPFSTQPPPSPKKQRNDEVSKAVIKKKRKNKAGLSDIDTSLLFVGREFDHFQILDQIRSCHVMS